ncbi:MAG: hypothetical protein AABW82_01970 [Nanoarchaeota archaeon]
MTKMLFKLFSALVLSLFLISMASAYYYPDYTYGNSRETVSVERSKTEVIHHPYGTERKTTKITETSRVNNFLPQYYPTTRYNSPNFYPYTGSSNFRNQPTYYYPVLNWYNDGQANYPDDYYYKPRFDTYQGSYNWRY